MSNSQFTVEENMNENSYNSNEKIQDKIKELENKKEEKNKEIDRLEKEYLEKIAKLLIMTQIHCEIKNDIYTQFDKMGITSHVEEVKDGVEQSFSKNQ